MLTAEALFSGMTCGRDHQHQYLEGNKCFGSRASLVFVWPDKLNETVLQAMLQQDAAERSAASGVAEVFPSEVRSAAQQLQLPRTKRTRRVGRVSRLTDQLSAPPVYVRPDRPTQPELPQEVPELGDEQPAHLDDSSIRAAQVADLDPVLNITEAERRRRWLTISPEVRKILRDLHVQFGHPTNTTGPCRASCADNPQHQKHFREQIF